MPRRVIILEDEGIIALDLESQLQAAGYEIVGITGSAAAAIAVAADQKAEIALVDLYLKTGIALDTGRHLAARGVDVIYMTGAGNVSLTAVDDHAVGLLFKPFEPEQLFALLAQAGRRHDVSHDHAPSHAGQDAAGSARVSRQSM